MSQLAINGGSPVRQSLLPYGRQFLDEDDKKSVIDVLGKDLITRGPQVKAFEKSVARYVGRPHAVGFHTATAGLHATMAMFGVQEGKKVAVPAITFAATANSVAYCGAEIEFVDVDPQTLNIDVSKLKKPEDYAAVYSVDFAGNPCDYEALEAWRGDHPVPLVADAAHSLGATYRGQKVGSLVDATVFSFHPVKSVTSGEGGCVVVNKERHYEFLKMFRNHGIGQQQQGAYFDQEVLGFNYHLTEMQGALGVSQMKKLDSFIAKRNKIATRYDEFFKDFADLCTRPSVTPSATSAWHLYPLRLNLESLSVNRDEFLKALRAENIFAQVHYVPVYWHSYYQKRGFSKGLCPVAEKEYARELSLPIFPAMSQEDQESVFEALKKLFKAFRA